MTSKLLVRFAAKFVGGKKGKTTYTHWLLSEQSQLPQLDIVKKLEKLLEKGKQIACKCSFFTYDLQVLKYGCVFILQGCGHWQWKMISLGKKHTPLPNRPKESESCRSGFLSFFNVNFIFLLIKQTISEN